MKSKITVLFILVTFVLSTSLIAQAKKKPEELYQTGVAKLKAGELKEAEALFKQVIEAQDFHMLAHLNLGNVYMKMENPAEAKKAFIHASKLAVKEALPHITLGKFYLSQGDQAEAAKALRKAFDREPDAPVCAEVAPVFGWERVGGQWLSAAEKEMLAKAPDQAFGFAPGEKRNYSHHYRRGQQKDWEGTMSIEYEGKRIVQGRVAYRFLTTWNYTASKRLVSMAPGSRSSGGQLKVSLQWSDLLDVTSQGFPLHYEGDTASRVHGYVFGGSYAYDFTPEGIIYADHTNNVSMILADYRYFSELKKSDFDKVEISNRYLGGMTKDELFSIYDAGKDFFVDHLPMMRNIPLYLFLQSGEAKAKYAQSKIIFPNTGDATYRVVRNLSDISTDSGFPLRDLLKFYPPVCTMRDFDFSRKKDKIKVHGKEIECYKVQTDFYESIDFWVLENGKIVQAYFPIRDEYWWLDK